MAFKVPQFIREFRCTKSTITGRLRHSRLAFYYLTTSLSIVLIIFIYSLLVYSLNYRRLIQSLREYDSTNTYENHLSTSRHFNINKSLNNAAASDTGSDVKRILFWTPFFRVQDYGFGTGQDAFVNIAKCPVHNCMTTTDRNLVNQSDAIIFHPPDVNVKDLPRHRMVHQRYIFFFFEAHFSYRNYPIFQNPVTNTKFFNWTMTYRRDSDVYDSRYGSILRWRNQSDAMTNQLPATLSPEESPPDPSSLWKFRQHSDVANRTKLVAWFVTNCNTPSRREIFFRQVANYIPIDIFGGCGPLKCLPSRSAKCDKLLDDYKFYIAAENNICADYITEKFYRALEIGVVPIVYGGADYAAYAPPHSYINAADFQSPQALADYLLLLDGNPRLYSKYLDWNKDWKVNKRKRLDGWCRLCEKLNAPTEKDRSNSVKIYENMAKWFYDKIPCLPGTSIIMKKHKTAINNYQSNKNIVSS